MTSDKRSQLSLRNVLVGFSAFFKGTAIPTPSGNVAMLPPMS